MSAKLKAPFAIEWLIVTPKMAAEWLKTNVHNRALREPTVDAYARDMAAGEWLPNHQGLAFAKDGRLLDGQHRLSAIVKSKCAVAMLVCTDVPERVEGKKAAVMDTVDRGAVRSIPDILRLQHGVLVDANMVTAASVIISLLSVADPTAIKKASVSQVLGVLELFRDGLRYVCQHRPRTHGLRSATVCGAVAFAHAAAPEATTEFFGRFGSGLNLDATSPELHGRNYFLGSPSREGVMDRLRNAELILELINARRLNEGLARLPIGRSGAAWFRSQLAERIKAVQALFPDAATPRRTMSELGKLRNPNGVTRFARDLPAVSPAAYVVKSAADVKLTPLAESLLRAKDVSDRLHRKIARQEGGAR